MTPTRAALLDLLAEVQKDPVYVHKDISSYLGGGLAVEDVLAFVLSRAAYMSHEGFAALIPKLDAFAKERAKP